MCRIKNYTVLKTICCDVIWSWDDLEMSCESQFGSGTSSGALILYFWRENQQKDWKTCWLVKNWGIYLKISIRLLHASLYQGQTNDIVIYDLTFTRHVFSVSFNRMISRLLSVKTDMPYTRHGDRNYFSTTKD